MTANQISTQLQASRGRSVRSRLLGAGLAAALTCTLAVPLYRAVAHDDGDGDDGAPGGSIDGSVVLKAEVALQPTTAAPAGASGKVELKARNRDGTVVTKLEVKTFGLAAADYLLKAVRKSDGTSVDLGMIGIGLSDDDGDADEESAKSGHDQAKDRDSHDSNSSSNSKSNGSHDSDQHSGSSSNDNDNDNHSSSHSSGHDSGMLASETEVVLPAGLDPLDISQIIVADVSGTSLLVADLVNVSENSRVQYKAAVKLEGAEAAPFATGRAAASTSDKKGKRTDRFTLSASRLPANTTFNVVVNGQTLTTAKSDKKGRLMVKKLEANNLMLSSVRLVDDQDRLAAKARF